MIRASRWVWILAAIAGAASLSLGAAPGSTSLVEEEWDVIQLRNAKSVKPVLLLDGVAASAPTTWINDAVTPVPAPSGLWNYLLYLVLGRLNHPVSNMVPPPAGAASEVGVFAFRRAMLLDIAPAWTAGADDHLRENLLASLRVPLNIWVPDGDALALELAKAEMYSARFVYGRTRTGLTVTGAVHDTVASLLGTGKGCDDVPYFRSLGPPVYRADQMNVYYVSDIVFTGYDTWSGLNAIDCGGLYAGPGNISFVSLPDHLPIIVAHEVGHGLSLRHAGTGNYMMGGGFTTANVMYDAGDLETAQLRNELSLGQSYRLNVDQRSWLNAGAAALRTGPTKTCADDFTSVVPCPIQDSKWP
jgi:hypothetical protein